MIKNNYAPDQTDSLLHTPRARAILEELFTNTIYFPIVLILLEWIPQRAAFFTGDIAIYALLLGMLAQAYFLGNQKYKGAPHPLIGNLIAPGIYTFIEVLLEGSEFFEGRHHIAYWIFAVAIGIIQALRLRVSGRGEQMLQLLENVVRTSILLVGYWIFEYNSHPELNATFRDFLSDDSHIFMTLSVLFIGLVLGFANVTASAFLSALRETSAKLQRYSEWLLGRNLLAQAIADPNALALQRQERAVLFMDIRNFTRWGETQAPEFVVEMLNAYFETGEPIWARYQAIKAKPSADEIMVIFSNASDAAQAGLELRQNVRSILQKHGLSAGIGIHVGPVIEGIMGSQQVKGYDVIGDVVNTAKRICDQAAENEILISEEVYKALYPTPNTLEARQINAKGKTNPITVYPLTSIASEMLSIR